MPKIAKSIEELIEQLPLVSNRPFATAGEQRHIGVYYHLTQLRDSELINDNLSDKDVAALKESLDTIGEAILEQGKPDSAEKRDLMNKADDSIRMLGLQLNHLMSQYVVDRERGKGPGDVAYAADKDLEGIKWSIEYLGYAMNLEIGYGIPVDVQSSADDDAEIGKEVRKEEERKAALTNQQAEEAPQNEQEQEVPQEEQNVPQEEQVQEGNAPEVNQNNEPVQEGEEQIQEGEDLGNLNINQEVKEAEQKAPKKKAKPIDMIIEQVPMKGNTPFGVAGTKEDGCGIYYHLTGLYNNNAVKTLAGKDDKIKTLREEIKKVARPIAQRNLGEEKTAQIKENATEALNGTLASDLAYLYDQLKSAQADKSKNGDGEIAPPDLNEDNKEKGPLSDLSDQEKKNLTFSIQYLARALHLDWKEKIPDEVETKYAEDKTAAVRFAKNVEFEREREKNFQKEVEQAKAKQAELKQNIADDKKALLGESTTLYDYLEKLKHTLLGDTDKNIVENYMLDMLAARMVAGAPRDKKSYLKKFNIEERVGSKEEFEKKVAEARESLLKNKFVQRALAGTGKYLIEGRSLWLRGMIEGGHGGKVEDHIRRECCKVSAEELKEVPERFRPTAKERIEYLQGRLSKMPKNKRDGDEAKSILCEIAGIRAAVGAVRNHKASLEKPYDLDAAKKAAEQVQPAIDLMVKLATEENHPGSIAKSALAGHGGKLEDNLRMVAQTAEALKKKDIPDFYTNDARKKGKSLISEDERVSRDSVSSDRSDLNDIEVNESEMDRVSIGRTSTSSSRSL